MKLLTLLVLTVGAAVDSGAQVSRNNDVEVQAARYAVEHLLGSATRVVFDPGAKNERSGERIELLRKAVNAGRVATSREVVSCASTSPSSCKLVAADAIISIQNATVESDVAVITVGVIRPTGLSRVPLHHESRTLEFRKRANGWVLDRVISFAIS